MRTKEKDILYCGVRKDKIQEAQPEFDFENLETFMYYIKERYNIHMKKDVLKKRAPWTEDELMKKYRFTNVYREHDKETKWLIKNIAENSWLTYRQKILNIMLFRMYNKHEVFEIIGAPFKMEGVWECKAIVEKLRAHLSYNDSFCCFNNAFLTSGMKRILKAEFPKHKDFVSGLPIWKIKKLNESNFFTDLSLCKSQEEVYNLLKELPAIGSFLAYQIFVDFTYIKEFPFSENEFTVAGPGCKRGIDRVFEDKDGMTYEECIFWLRDNWKNLNYMDYYFDPEEEMLDMKHYDRVMNVMSLENCFCEISKYIKAMKGEGRPRSSYKPRKRG